MSSNKKTYDTRAILKRIEGLMGAENEKHAAKKLGVAPQTYSNWKSRGTIPWENLFTYCLLQGHDFDYVISGEPPEPEPYKMGEDFEEIRKYKSRLSGGPGEFSICEDKNVETTFAFRKDWIHKKGNPEKLGLFEVNGESMYPTISSGDLVLVDLNDKEKQSIHSGKIYAIAEGIYLKVKKLVYKGSELWIYSSKESGDEPYRAPENEHLRIIGRVVWVGHELK